jgi:4-amino-4-deoxy-L-arabinose transferase-like glycosyltransferase
LWVSGLAGAIPSAIAFLLAGAFLYAAACRIFDCASAALAATALFALNPNVLYLQSIPMTESLFSACLLALLYFTVRFRDTQGWGALTGAGIAACAATLTRYEGWFLLPFAAVYLTLSARRHRILVAVIFSLLAGLGPLFVLAHHWWITGDALAFYRGPYSPRAIQGSADYPGKSDWREAFRYYRTAAQLCAGACLPLLALAGALGALYRRAFWPLLLLALPGIFFVWSMRFSGGTPIFLPLLPPFSFYNSRYGLAVMPFFALAAAGLVAAPPAARRRGRARRSRRRISVDRRPLARQLGHLGGIARQFRRAPRMDPPGRRLPPPALRPRFRHPHRLRRSYRHLPHPRHPPARDLHAR